MGICGVSGGTDGGVGGGWGGVVYRHCVYVLICALVLTERHAADVACIRRHE